MSRHGKNRFTPVRARVTWVHLLLSLLFILAAAAGPRAYAQAYSEVEPNDPCANAQDLGSVGSSVQVAGYKTQPYGDAVDYFRFWAPPGTQLQVALSGDLSQPNPLTGFGIGIFTPDCPAWPYPSAFTGNTTARLIFTVPADGTFIIGVTACCDTNFSGSGTIEGAYLLSVGPPPPPTVITGIVSDADTGIGLPGNEPPYASVTLEQCFDWGGYWGYCYYMQSTQTDSQGYFRFEGNLEGNLRVRINTLANVDPFLYEQPKLVPTGPNGWESVLITQGTNYDFGVIPLVRIVPVDSISGQVTDRVTGRPLAGTVEPFARVQLSRRNQYGWWEWIADSQTGPDGTYRFSSATVGRTLLRGDYQIVAYANQYQTIENWVDVFNVQPREARVAPVLRLKSNPVRITDVKPCDSIPAQGGTCDFSYRVTSGTASRMSGTAWSLVRASGTGGFTNGTQFAACEQPLTLVSGTTAASQEVRCQFSVPANVPAYAYYCADARFGEDSRANPHMTVQGLVDPLFCVMKPPGLGGFKVLPQRGAVELMRQKGIRR